MVSLLSELLEIEAGEPDEVSDKVERGRVPSVLPVLPLRNAVIYPGITMPISVGREKSLRVLGAAGEGSELFAILTQRTEGMDDPDFPDLYQSGCVVKLLKRSAASEGSVTALVHGVARCRLVEPVDREPHLTARFRLRRDRFEPDVELEALAKTVKQTVKRIIELSPNIPDEIGVLVDKITDPVFLADLVAHYLEITIPQKMEILELVHVHERLRRLTGMLNREQEVLELTHRIQDGARGRMEKQQREYFLREQLKIIKKELGEGEGEGEHERLREEIAGRGLPEHARKSALKEWERLDRMHSSSPEYQVSRTWLDWLLELPWHELTDDILDVARAGRILDEDHYDLERVKRRILEYLAVSKLKQDLKGPILCLQGPPGVGKTSLGKSVARALGRRFVRISLGGIRDEAEIRGHRRTYVGALPGRIIQGMKRAGTINPVFMLDEIDKLGQDFRGDPSSALLEALDPEQNDAFSDHYLDVSYNLSRVLFVTTANSLDPIPPALRDRLEVITLPGYSQEEKLAIARTFLVPEQIREHGLQPRDIAFGDPALREIIHAYTREAGVRNLKREIASVCRAVAKEKALGASGRTRVGRRLVQQVLGPVRFVSDVASRVSRPGVATGMVWTPVGGDILFIEATGMPGKGELILTGQLGDVMRESARAALSYLRANGDRLGLPAGLFADHDIHIHVPEGATPKDGPSAGVTILTSLYSLAAGRKVRRDTALTGEITLRGAVLPVGGVKEKVLAAHRAGIRRIVLPSINRKDLEEIPLHIRETLEFCFVDDMERVLALAVEGPAGGR